MTMDVTLHPCINSKVGPYAQNKRAHRVCEMNQDVHAFQRLNLGAVDLPERLKTGIRRCAADGGGLTGDMQDVSGVARRGADPTGFAEPPPAPHDEPRRI